MGFGKGKGFTEKPKPEQTSYLIKGGGGKAAVTATEANPTYTVT